MVTCPVTLQMHILLSQTSLNPHPWVEQKPPFIHLKWIVALRLRTCLLRDGTSDDMEPPPTANTNPDVDPPLSCAFTLLVSRVFIYTRVVELVEVNLYLLAMIRLMTYFSFVAAAARFPR